MKTRQFLGVILALFVAVGISYAGPKELSLKAGDTAYVCGCGEKCPCEMVSKKAGKCSCDHDLAKVTVKKVEAKKAFYEADGKQRSVKLDAKYACDCGGDCCLMVSQKAGKCPCGKELAEVKKEKAK